MEQISFGTDGWRATLDTFTEERVRCVGQAVATYLRDEGRGGGTVAIGYDARETSRGFADALADVLAGNGIDVLVAERDCPTPALAWTVADRGLDGGLVVTASHNPPEYNGVKFVPADGAPAPPGVTDDLEERLAEPTFVDDGERGRVSEETFTSRYGQHVLGFVGECGDAPLDLSGLTVAYDAMHGSGRGVTDALLEEAGADVTRLRCDRDPAFGGVSPEPSADRLSALIDRVTGGAADAGGDAGGGGSADLGVANDGDADRVAVVTPRRGALDANLLFAVLYDYLLTSGSRSGSRSRSGSGSGSAVRTVSTTFLIDRVAAAHGEDVVEVPVGFKWVAAAMADHDALMGGEESGGFGLTDHLRNKDGVLIALLAAKAHTERPLDVRVDALLDEHGEIHQSRVSVDCPDDRKAAVIADLEEALPDAVAGVEVDRVGTKDGFKVLLADGSWLLLRPSGTEPKLRVYAEAESEDRVAELLAAGRDLVEPLV